MTYETFTYWLQGFFELTDAKELTPEQVKMIKIHLAYVFNKTYIQPRVIAPSTDTGSIILEYPTNFVDATKTVIC